PLTAKSEEEKISYLLIWSGEEGIELVSTWSLTNEEKKKLSTYWKKFEEYVAPKSNFRLASRPRVQAKLLEYDATLTLHNNTVIAHLKAIFEEHGIPSKFVTGHDTQFTSATFHDFSQTYGFVLVTTSPYYKQANGFIERNVGIIKNVLQKCKESGADPHRAMLCLRTTPLDHKLPSPAELLNSRVYQSNLPAVSKSALFNTQDHDANIKLQTRQDRQKEYYDKTSKALPPVYPHDSVRVFNPRNLKWESGIVQASTQTPRSYTVNMSDGSTLTRNRRHMRPTGEKFSISSDDKTLAASPSYSLPDNPLAEVKPPKQEESTPPSVGPSA
ncbi:hypothetical protein QZH41_016321, partial [Actinostola sp. cb2023]